MKRNAATAAVFALTLVLVGAGPSLSQTSRRAGGQTATGKWTASKVSRDEMSDLPNVHWQVSARATIGAGLLLGGEAVAVPDAKAFAKRLSDYRTLQVYVTPPGADKPWEIVFFGGGATSERGREVAALIELCADDSTR